MKSSEWIQMIWDTIPEAESIGMHNGSVAVFDKKGVCLTTISMVNLKLDYDVPLQATRPAETERLSVCPDREGVLRFGWKGVSHYVLPTALSIPSFLGYELADGTMSPRLEAGMDVVAVHFKKG